MACNVVTDTSVLLIGAGPMAREYIKVLLSLGCPFIVVCRSGESKKRLESFFKEPIRVVSGGAEKYLSENPVPSHVIVATEVLSLYKITARILAYKVQAVLVEKPACLSLEECEKLKGLSRSQKVKLVVGYNRRFYESVREVKRRIVLEGGVRAISFDFTEWSERVGVLAVADEVKQRWFFANSSHVADLAIFLGGTWDWLHARTQGSMLWHSAGSQFFGIASAKSGLNISYRADWGAPGRWAISLYTTESKYDLSPLEELSRTARGSLKPELVLLSDRLDREFKPGLFLQVRDFLVGNFHDHCGIEEHTENMRFYSQIAGY